MKSKSMLKVRVPSGTGEVVSPRDVTEQSHVPPMVHQRGPYHPDLADDLRPSVQGFAGLAPLSERERRPRRVRWHA